MKLKNLAIQPGPEKGSWSFSTPPFRFQAQTRLFLDNQWVNLFETQDLSLSAKPQAIKAFVDSGGGWWAGGVDLESTSPYTEQWTLLPSEDQALIDHLSGDKPPAGFHNSIGGIGALVDPKSDHALIAAFLTFNRASNHVVWHYQKNKLAAWAACNFAGYRLKPGETIRSEKLFLGFASDSLKGLEQYATLAAQTMKVKLPKTPPMDWCSWYAYRLKITENIVLENAAALKKHFPGYDFSYIQVDHGWQFQDICGHWTRTNDRFPHGLKWLANNLNKTGYALGLWTGFFTVLESSPIFKKHPEYMIQDRRGNPQQMPYLWAWVPHDHVYYLDPTHPKVPQFIQKTFTTLRNAGCRYWKIDFTWGIANNEPNAVHHEPDCVKGAEIYRKGLSLIRQTLKNDYTYWCSNPTNLGFGLGATSMTACDIGNPGFRQAKQIEGRTENLDFYRQCLTTVISRFFLHKKLILLNPDVVEVGGAADPDEARIRLSLVAFAGGQVFLGDILTELTADQWNLLEKCIPPYGQAARPVDLFDHTWPKSYPHIWHLPIKTGWGSWDLVVLFNLTEKPENIRVDFARLGLEKNAEYLAFEFWNKTFLGKAKNALTLKMEPVTTKLLLLKKPSNRPMILATDMHVTQGAVELANVKYDPKSKTLKGLASRQKGSQGNLFVWVPGCKNLIVHPLSFDRPNQKWEFRC